MWHLKLLGLRLKELAPEAIAPDWHTFELVGTSLNHFEDQQIEIEKMGLI